MNELQSLSALGLELPSAAYLVGMVLFSLIGYVAYRRGRSSKRSVLTWTGVVLMLYPTPYRKLGCCGSWVPRSAAGYTSNGTKPVQVHTKSVL